MSALGHLECSALAFVACGVTRPDRHETRAPLPRLAASVTEFARTYESHEVAAAGLNLTPRIIERERREATGRITGAQIGERIVVTAAGEHRGQLLETRVVPDEDERRDLIGNRAHDRDEVVDRGLVDARLLSHGRLTGESRRHAVPRLARSPRRRDEHEICGQAQLGEVVTQGLDGASAARRERTVLVALLGVGPARLRVTQQVQGPHAGSTAWLAGSMRIFACASGSARAAKALATPSSPTTPVTTGAAATLPSARRCSASRNSRGVYPRTKRRSISLLMAIAGRMRSGSMQTPTTTTREKIGAPV